MNWNGWWSAVSTQFYNVITHGFSLVLKLLNPLNWLNLVLLLVVTFLLLLPSMLSALDYAIVNIDASIDSALSAGMSAAYYLAFVNTAFPLSETIGFLAMLAILMAVAWAIRIVKSFWA
jgi:cation transport ATPase